MTIGVRDRPKLLYFTGRYRPDSMAVPVHAELVRALGERGWPGAIVTLGPADQRVSVARTDDGGLPIFSVATSHGALDRLLNRLSRRRWGYTYLLSASRRLRPWLGRVLAAAPDTILQVEMAFPMGAIVRRAVGGRGTRSVVTLRGGDVLLDPDGAYGYARSPRVRRELGHVFAWAGSVRAISPLLARRARDLGCPADKLAVVPTNIDALFYPTGPLSVVRAAARRGLAAELGLPPDAPLLLSGGRVLAIKGFDTLVTALPRVLARHPATHLVLYGPDRGNTTGALRAQIAAAGLTERVHILGEVPFAEQGRYLAAADLVAIPSTLDGFNKTGAEAAAHGTPLVVSTSAGIADYVAEWGAGRVVPPRDPAALAEAVAGLLGDREEWHAASAAAVRLSDECRTARVADGLAALYERIAPAVRA